MTLSFTIYFCSPAFPLQFAIGSSQIVLGLTHQLPAAEDDDDEEEDDDEDEDEDPNWNKPSLLLPVVFLGSSSTSSPRTTRLRYLSGPSVGSDAVQQLQSFRSVHIRSLFRICHQVARLTRRHRLQVSHCTNIQFISPVFLVSYDPAYIMYCKSSLLLLIYSRIDFVPALSPGSKVKNA